MPHHDPTEFPENPCPTGECVWDMIGGKRVEWCNECGIALRDEAKRLGARCCYDLDAGHAPTTGHGGFNVRDGRRHGPEGVYG
jgi:hypothetical protein